MSVNPQTQRAVVEGVNLAKKHIRRNQDYPQGGIIDKEAPIHVSNLRVTEVAEQG
jgi:large subunit ribosomal protein L24